MHAKSTALYRHYDKDNRLLYVGISTSPIARLEQHMGSAHWTHRIVFVKITRYSDRETAQVAESQAIRKEKPLYNLHGRSSASLLPSDIARGNATLMDLERDSGDRDALHTYQSGLYSHWCAQHAIDSLPKSRLSKRQLDAYKRWERQQLLFYALAIANRRLANAYQSAYQSEESKLAVSVLMQARVRHLYAEYTVRELVEKASEMEHGGIDQTDGNRIGIDSKVAQRLLERIGIRVLDDFLLFSNNSEQLHKQIPDLPYASDLRNLLLSLRGASRYGQKSVRFAGFVSKCIAVPLDSIFED